MTYSLFKQMYSNYSLVHRLFAYCKRSNTGGGNGLGTRTTKYLSSGLEFESSGKRWAFAQFLESKSSCRRDEGDDGEDSEDWDRSLYFIPICCCFLEFIGIVQCWRQCIEVHCAEKKISHSFFSYQDGLLWHFHASHCKQSLLSKVSRLCGLVPSQELCWVWDYLATHDRLKLKMQSLSFLIDWLYRTSWNGIK